jgi:hypothetical protein
MARDRIDKNVSVPSPLVPQAFNPKAKLPYGLLVEHIGRAMKDYLAFLGFVNQALKNQKIQRIETFLMPANFSSIVGEFMTTTIPKYCRLWQRIAITTDTRISYPWAFTQRTLVSMETGELK